MNIQPTPPRRPDHRGGSDGVADIVVTAIVLLGLVVALARHPPAALPPLTAAAAPEPMTLRFVPGGREVARYTDRDRTLTISEHAPRDLLICIRGRCDLAEAWIGK